MFFINAFKIQDIFFIINSKLLLTTASWITLNPLSFRNPKLGLKVRINPSTLFLFITVTCSAVLPSASYYYAKNITKYFSFIPILLNYNLNVRIGIVCLQ